jgi:hypothetical protein
MPFSMEWIWNRYSVIKLLLEFPDAFLRGVDEGSILGDDEVW